MSGSQLYAESRDRLSQRLQSSVTNTGSIARQVVKGSKCAETLNQAVKVTTSLDTVIESTESNLRKSEAMTHHMKLCLMNSRLIEVDRTHQKLDICLEKFTG